MHMVWNVPFMQVNIKICERFLKIWNCALCQGNLHEGSNFYKYRAEKNSDFDFMISFHGLLKFLNSIQVQLYIILSSLY